MFNKPQVTLLHASPLWISECAGRTAYDSFSKSENACVRNFPNDDGECFKYVNDIESSELLTQLAWVYHHTSVLELVDLTFSIKGISRGVLQQHSRHRISSLTVQSTRYTMSDVIYAYIASSVRWEGISEPSAKGMFNSLNKQVGTLIYTDDTLHNLECDSIYDKLKYLIGTNYEPLLSTEGKAVLKNKDTLGDQLFLELQKTPTKKNIGDSIKGSIVSDAWSVDLICKFNLRSLKNYYKLRKSGAAWNQIQWLAQAMQEVTPKKYLDLIVKEKQCKT